MRKRWVATLAALLVLCVLVCAAPRALADGESLLTNGGFEALDADGWPNGWYSTQYRDQEGFSRVAVTDERAHSGLYCAIVENATLNDARFVCTVKVEPESLYRLSGYVLVEYMEALGAGANLAIEGVYAASERLRDTGGDWRYIEWYGETGENQTELTLGVRVGGYSAESVGKAYFDDIELVKVDALPEEIVASIWYSTRAADDAAEETDASAQKSTVWFALCALAFWLLCLFSRPLLGKKRVKPSQAALLLAGVALLALAIRVLLGAKVAGYEVDINCFTAWSLRMADVGPAAFYAEGYFCDYPPGYMLLLWPCGLILRALGATGTPAALLAVKSVPILCDLAGALLLYRYATKRLGNLPSLCLASLYLFSPAVLVNGAAWGQVDSVLALLIALTAIQAMENRWKAAIPLFVLSVLVKPQALLFAPIGGMWLVHSLIHAQKKCRSKAWADIAIGAGLGALVAAAVVAPFVVNQADPVGWLVSQYGETLASYDRATLNTANLYYLAGANWVELTSDAPVWLIAVTACAAAALAVVPFILDRVKALREAKLAAETQKKSGKKKDPKAKIPERLRRLFTKNNLLGMLNALLAGFMLVLCFAGASYGLYGYAMMAYAFLFTIFCLMTDGRAEALPFYLALSLIGVYTLGVKVHERYLFAALLLLPLAYVRLRDRRFLWLFVGFSITTFLNTAIVLDNSILFGSSMGHLNDDTLVLNLLLCVANLALAGFAGYNAATGLRESAIPADDSADELPAREPSSYERMLLSPKDARLRLTCRDWIIMGATAVVYGALAFANLGSTVAPQTGWVSTSADEYAVFELEQSQPFKVLYYAGVSHNPFSISVSEDGQNWSNDYPCKMEDGLCYRWNYALQSETTEGETQYAANNTSGVLILKGKYLRVNAEQAGLNLWEIVARDENGNDLPLKLADWQNGNPELLENPKPADNLIDEPHTCVGEPGWYNGTYFDEIYHARTAYEHLHGQSTHEWTHPPLGKLMMSACIAIFGMTPFGWRFAGAFIGVLMLPALYMLALQLTKKRSLATFSMLALALDLMHYTQTRIATIDSFPVFFIILTYLCMARYMQTDVIAMLPGEKPRLFTRAFRRSLIPLLLCGIFMGMSIASKWIGMYSAVGLALLFFVTVYRQYRAGLAAWGHDPDDPEEAFDENAKLRIASAREYTLKRILVTCGLCVLFFVAIPCLIYYLSYIPQLAPTGPVTVSRIWKLQQDMYNYHSKPGLGMDHPFQSPWWQWPLLMKPIWFVQDGFEPEGFASSILCFGNPWVCYIGAACMLIVLAAFIHKYVKVCGGLALRHGDGDLTLTVLVVGFLAQYLPWTLVPRSMYMYHYFASIPFLILATAWLVGRIPDGRKRLRDIVMGVYLAGAAALFVLYFPYASGWLTPTGWLDTAKQCFRPTLLEWLTTGEINSFIKSMFRLYY